MPFISNADNFTLGEGTYINVQGSYHVHINNGTKRRRDEIEDEELDGLMLTDRPGKRRRLKEGAANGLKVIRQKNLQLIRQIGSGPGYLLHAGRNKSRAVTVKVFNGSNPMAQQQLDLEVTLLKGVIHPNVPRIQGVSSPTSVTHFIAYEDVCGRNAKGPLADALQNRTRSIRLGLKMVADLSAGLGYLSTQSTSLGGMKVENFDVFLDVRDRFLLIINPNSLDEAHANSQSSQDERTWALFNGLCDKVLLSANRVLHTEEIDRDPAVLPPTSAPHKFDSSSFCIGLSSLKNEQEDTGAEAVGSAGDPRREYVWRALERGKQSLATVADQMTTHLNIALARLQRLTQTEGQRAHRCRGYMREEITLAPTIVDSAVVAHDTPRPLEICSICHEIVGWDEVFQCICGDSGAGSRYTVKCTLCKFWSHRDCTENDELDFICRFCEGFGEPDSSCHSPPTPTFPPFPPMPTLSSTSSPSSSPPTPALSLSRFPLEGPYHWAHGTTTANIVEWSTHVPTYEEQERARAEDMIGSMTPTSSSTNDYPTRETASPPKWISSWGGDGPEGRTMGVNPAPEFSLLFAPLLNEPTILNSPSVGWTSFAKAENILRDNFQHDVTSNARSQRRPRVAFECPLESCSSTFTERHNLINHINSHNKYRPHGPCLCGLSFTTQVVLDRHKKDCIAEFTGVPLPSVRHDLSSYSQPGSQYIPVKAEDENYFHYQSSHMGHGHYPLPPSSQTVPDHPMDDFPMDDCTGSY